MKCRCVFISAAVVAIVKSPLATSYTAVAEAALRAVWSLASSNEENKAKLGAVGGCEGG